MNLRLAGPAQASQDVDPEPPAGLTGHIEGEVGGAAGPSAAALPEHGSQRDPVLWPLP